MNVYQIVGYKNTGKTTLLCQLLQLYKSKGYRVGTIKHDAHQFEMDYPETDTWKHRQAGAEETAIISAHRTAWMEEKEASLDEIITMMQRMDIIFVEGFKSAVYPKIVMVKDPIDYALVDQLQGVTAIVSWLDNEEKKGRVYHHIPVFSLNDVNELMEYLENKKWM